MRLGINGWRLMGHRTGVGRYLVNVVRHWRDGTASALFDPITFYSPIPIDRATVDFAPIIRERLLGPPWRLLLWENLRFGPVANDDVLFCPSFSRPLIARGKVVVATHDVVYRAHPELFPRSVRMCYSRLYEWSDRHATLIIADSEAVKDDIVRYCGVPREKVRVTYLAPAECFRPMDDPTELAGVRARYLGAEAPYFLFVGKATGRRSLPLLVEAFAKLKQDPSFEHQLLLVGVGTADQGLAALIERLGLGQTVKHAGFVADEDLNAIYNGATALVSAAVYETSSLPVMEAQATGLPVICLRNPGMVEITGGAATLLDRLDPAELAEAMRALAADQGLRGRLAAEGLASAARFSWSRCARDTMAVLEEAATL